MYDLEFHLKKGSEETRTLFLRLNNKIKKFAPMAIINYTALYVGYMSESNFACIDIKKKHINISVRDIGYGELEKYLERVPDSHNHTLTKRLKDKFRKEEEILYVTKIIERSFRGS